MQDILTLKTFNESPPNIDPGAIVVRDAALAKARTVKQVTNPVELDEAIAAKIKLSELRLDMEASRKLIKAPVLKLGEIIDDKAREFIGEVIKAEQLIVGMINHYQRQQLQLREQMERENRHAEEARQREIARLEAEKQKAATPVEVAQIDEQLFDAQLAAESQSLVTVPEITGPQPKVTLDFEIIGKTEREQLESIYVFCQAYPELCKIELRRAAILERLNKGDGFRSDFPEEQPGADKLPKPPGIRVFEVTKTNIRARGHF